MVASPFRYDESSVFAAPTALPVGAYFHGARPHGIPPEQFTACGYRARIVHPLWTTTCDLAAHPANCSPAPPDAPGENLLVRERIAVLGSAIVRRVSVV